MTRHPAISETMWLRIQAELDKVECDNNVRIILAVESGSRAWGFPSSDSDYDVRILYLHPRDNYLSVFPAPDVINHALDAVFDVNGWDLRKAMRLLAGSNATVMEWLTSPIRYRGGGAAADDLLEVGRTVASLPAFAYHYDRLARRSLTEIEGSGDAVRLKAYCYALRGALALAWVRECGTPPPMDLPSLLAGVACSAEIRAAIADLVHKKAAATEKDMTTRIPVLDAYLGTVLAKPAERAAPESRPECNARIDGLFAALLNWSQRSID
jgi:predicted nucleotidyltransferase